MPRQRPAGVSQIVSAAELADLMGVDRHTIVDSWVPKDCPVVERAVGRRPWRFRVSDVVRWRIDTQDGNAASVGSGDLRDLQAEGQAIKNASDRLDLEAKRARLIEMDLVGAEVASAYAATCQRLLSRAPRIAARVQGETDLTSLERIVHDEMCSALEALVAPETFGAGGVADDEDDEGDEE
ncbi:terminase small subunit [Roseomonas sp. GC11]|uniref:terminase small subunit n=1 Tax=Roseomonas sp. GC11 TaxID=2950546 RepID=UPI00210C065F|nr:terminase small subunit [Roseomonas sp. GC11]MCQ4160871.1 terminase small subunit [Roseomonas sp. GC11]